MKHLNRFLFALLTLAMLAACAGPLNPTKTPGGGQTQPITVAISDKARNTDPVLTPSDAVSRLTAGNTAFAFSLYQQLISGSTGNLF